METCPSCRIPVGRLNTAVFSECNVDRCRRPAEIVCAGCLAGLVKRFEKHLAVMATLPTSSCDGWLRTNGGLRNRENKHVAAAVLEKLLAAAADGFVVRRTDAGVEHFSETVARAAGPLAVPTAYVDLVRRVPELPVQEAASALRRFVAERRRHWQEVPGRRAVVSLGVEAAPSATAMLWQSSALLDPGRLVTLTPGAARELAGFKADGVLHEFGRSVFYLETNVAPGSAAESKRRLRAWKRGLRKVSAPARRPASRRKR